VTKKGKFGEKTVSITSQELARLRAAAAGAPAPASAPAARPAPKAAPKPAPRPAAGEGPRAPASARAFDVCARLEGWLISVLGLHGAASAMESATAASGVAAAAARAASEAVARARAAQEEASRKRAAAEAQAAAAKQQVLCTRGVAGSLRWMGVARVEMRFPSSGLPDQKRMGEGKPLQTADTPPWLARAGRRRRGRPRRRLRRRLAPGQQGARRSAASGHDPPSPLHP
jgi:hypothetical protein